MMNSSSPTAAGLPPWLLPIHFRKLDVLPAAISFKTTTTSLHLHYLLRSFFKGFPQLNHIPKLKDVWCEKASQIKDINLLQISNDLFASASAYYLCLFPGAERNKDSGTKKQPHLETSGRSSSGGRNLTNVLLAANILVFAAQFATGGELMYWGAKINSLIDRGEIWRLVTSSFLHSGVLHLMVNCYSLNSVGPTVESLTGPRRFLAVYFTSAIASSTASYWFCKGPAVGASGAVFGLVGALAVYVLRHRTMIRGGGKQELQNIAQMILLNMVIGLLNQQIDNWGHVGGLIGGIGTSWLVGPAWKLEDSLSKDGRKVFMDRAPLQFLTSRATKGNGGP
ncbi:RHOMBOID-like protein 10, chloroplastic [Linum grandiflorum]